MTMMAIFNTKQDKSKNIDKDVDYKINTKILSNSVRSMFVLAMIMNEALAMSMNEVLAMSMNEILWVNEWAGWVNERRNE